MTIIEARLKELGIALSNPPKPVATYVPYTISGNQVFISGQVPIADGALQICRQAGRGFQRGRWARRRRSFAPSISCRC